MTTIIEQPCLVLGGDGRHHVSELLLGVNLEMVPANAASLLSNRLRNPKFGGPPDVQTGVAHEWMPAGFNMGGMHAKIIEGMFMSPSQCQMIHNYIGAYGAGLVQIGIPVRRGETLEFKIWAKVRHRPVCVEICLRPLASRVEETYAKVDILVDSAYWKCFSATFHMEKTDDDAAFFIQLKDTGVVLIDQVSLEPADSAGIKKDTEEVILRLNPPMIRFPGGCMSTNHHWRLGTGPRELRPSLPDPVFKTRTDYDFGTDEYLTLCRTLGISPHITVNIGSGTVTEAAEWAGYCRDWYLRLGESPPLIYFQMGNEQYGSWETSHMNAAMYVDALREFVPAVRFAYPDCRIIVLAEPMASGVSGEADTPLRELVLSEAKGLFDVLAINRYKGQWFDDPADQLRNAIDSVEKVRHDLELLSEDCRNAGVIPRLALTEWNYWLHAAQWDGKNFYEPDDALHGVFFSGMVHVLWRMADVIEIASYYHLLNAMGLMTEKKGRCSETAIGTLYRLYRSALPGRLVPMDLEWGNEGKLDSLVIVHEGITSLFVCHRALGEAAVVNLSDALGRVLSCQTLAAADCYSPMKDQTIHVVDGEVTLPPLSVTRIDFSGRPI